MVPSQELAHAVHQAATERARADSLYRQLQDSREAVRQLTQRLEQPAYTGVTAQVFDLEQRLNAALQDSAKLNHLQCVLLDLAGLCPECPPPSSSTPFDPAAVLRKRLTEFAAMERGRAKEAKWLRSELLKTQRSAHPSSAGDADLVAHQRMRRMDIAQTRADLLKRRTGDIGQHAVLLPASEAWELSDLLLLLAGDIEATCKEIGTLTERIHGIAKERNDAFAKVTIATQQHQRETGALKIQLKDAEYDRAALRRTNETCALLRKERYSFLAQVAQMRQTLADILARLDGGTA